MLQDMLNNCSSISIYYVTTLIQNRPLDLLHRSPMRNHYTTENVNYVESHSNVTDILKLLKMNNSLFSPSTSFSKIEFSNWCCCRVVQVCLSWITVSYQLTEQLLILQFYIFIERICRRFVKQWKLFLYRTLINRVCPQR